jgi:hypothetical protein
MAGTSFSAEERTTAKLAPAAVGAGPTEFNVFPLPVQSVDDEEQARVDDTIMIMAFVEHLR